MPAPANASEAIVICTRNRPTELRPTLDSIAAHPPSASTFLAVIDASDDDALRENREHIAEFGAVPAAHWPYPAAPSLPRQRNYALDRLPSSVSVVHFIDDDVTVQAGYFSALSDVLQTRPDVGGVGGVIVEPDEIRSAPRCPMLQRLFLLRHPEPGRVLPSGCTTSAQSPAAGAPAGLRDTQWLSGCSSSYRRRLLHRHRFDAALAGYAMLEDLDLSYRIGQEARLVVQPQARLRHRRAPRNRLDAERYARALTVHRRWFVEKHLGGGAARGAFWWSVVGRLLAVSMSSDPHRDAALRGVLQGIRTVWSHDHPLLRRGPMGAS